MLRPFGLVHSDPVHSLHGLWTRYNEASTVALGHDQPWIVLFATALALTCLAPVATFFVVRFTPHEGPERKLGATVLIFAYLHYFLYFNGTYHAPLLVLALLAWYIASLHVAELLSVNESTRDLRRSSGAIAQLNLETFYAEFSRWVQKARHRITSVERKWTWQRKSWAGIPFDQSGLDAAGLENAIKSIEKCSLFRSLLDTEANRCLIIGPMPIRDHAIGYSDDDFGELVAMVHTMCVCELSRYYRPLGSIYRMNVAVSDVPNWVKIVDYDYMVLQGESYSSLRRESFVASSVHGQFEARHRSRLEGHFEVIESYNRNARRAHEHIVALILERATALSLTMKDGDGHQNVRRVVEGLPAIIHSIKAETDYPSPLDSYLNSRGERLSANHISLLFGLFLAIHFYDANEKPTGANLSTVLGGLSYADLYSRLS